ncbi:MAG: DUF1415 domain-containing protein [Ferruginibacter sp.]
MDNDKMIHDDSLEIVHTTNWIKQVVIACNFCPFAAKALAKKSVRYTVIETTDFKTALTALANEFEFLNKNENIETTFLIFSEGFTDFLQYLDLVDKGERLLSKEDYEGIYQLASFHPQYLFAGSNENDPANYTNRSPYPMLHLLREDSITKVLENFNDPDSIPEKNIDFAKTKGLEYMKMLAASCL